MSERIHHFTEPSDPVERALLRLSWHDIYVLEQLREAPGRKLYANRWDAMRDLAHEKFVPREGGKALSQNLRAMYESPANVTRFYRTVEYLIPGDRVLEIGIGKGYLATMLISDGELEKYLGFDLVESNVTATNGMLAANGLDDRASARLGDLYDLTLADAEEIDASLIICCEVLEHVPDPEAALKVLADALPEGGELLFSTPLLARLEGVWGHTAMFGVERIREMLEYAGLVPHYIEALDNTWIMVLASKQEAPSPRVSQLLGKTLDAMSTTAYPEDRPRAIRNQRPVDLKRVKGLWTKRMDTEIDNVKSITDSVNATPEQVSGLRLRATPQAKRTGSKYAGIAFGIPEDQDVHGIRLQLNVPDPEQFDTLYVDFRKGEDLVARWTWRPSERMPKNPNPTFVLHRYNKGAFFQKSTIKGEVTSADTVEIFGKVKEGSDAELRLLRFGWVV